MDTILLVVSNSSLRQLYHELLFSPSVEIVPSRDIGSALLQLALQEFSAAIVYIDDDNEQETVAFLQLRRKQLKLLKTKLILLTVEKSQFEKYVIEHDKIIEIDHVTPGEMAEIISSSLK